MAMSAECPSSEVDELTVSLVNVFESRGLGFVLLEALIKLEVDETGKRNSFPFPKDHLLVILPLRLEPILISLAYVL